MELVSRWVVKALKSLHREGNLKEMNHQRFTEESCECRYGLGGNVARKSR